MRNIKLQVIDRRIQDHELRRESRMFITYILFLLYINYVRTYIRFSHILFIIFIDFIQRIIIVYACTSQ